MGYINKQPFKNISHIIYIILFFNFISHYIILQTTLITNLAFIFSKLVATTLLKVITAFSWSICRLIPFYAIYKISYLSRRGLRTNSRYVGKFVIILAFRFEFAFWILSVYKIKLVFLIIVEIAQLCKLMHWFLGDDRGIQIIDKAVIIKWSISEAGGKSEVTSICLDNIFAKVYIALICRINTLLDSIKLNTEFIEVFGYW